MFSTSRRGPRQSAANAQRRLWLRGLEQRIVPATFYVDRLDDAAVADPNDPFTGSLRYVIEKANEIPGCDDVIIIKMGTIQLLSPLEIKDEIIIDPYGASESILDFSQIDYSKHKSAIVIDDCNPLTSMHVSFEAVSIIGGRAPQGGVIFVQNEDLVIKRCVLSGNQATVGHGGAIYFAGGPGAKLTIIDSTISGNSAVGHGGGVYIKGIVTTVIRNSTISGNTALGQGGGIAFSGEATLDFFNSTITKNAAVNGLGGGGIARIAGPGTVNLQSTIVAQNSAAQAPDLAFDTPTVVVANNALIGVADQGKFMLMGTPNFTGESAAPLNALLGDLLDNGGETKTHAPLPGSPVINNGNNNAGLIFDQRGPSFSRVVDGLADIGAFEVSAIPYAKSKRLDVTMAGALTFDVEVTYTDPLGGAINVGSIGLDDITVIRPNGLVLAPATFKVSDLTNGSPRTATYTFTAPGGTWDAGDNGTYSVQLAANQVFDADTIANAVPAGSLGDFLVSIPSAIVVNATNDEALDTDGKVSLREAILSTPGGVITFDKTLFATPQTITLTLGELVIAAPVTIVGPESARVTIDANKNSRVVKVDGPGTGMAVAFLNLTFLNGSTAGPGGGIWNVDESLRMTNCLVAGSSAGGVGGGLAVGAGGSLAMYSCQISNNSSMGNGGGVAFQSSGRWSVFDSALVNNTSKGSGGGFVLQSVSSAQLANTTISGNQAAEGGGGGYLSNFIGALLINNSTIANNISTSSFNGGGLRGGGASGTVTLQSTILATNTAMALPIDLFFDTGMANIGGDNNIVGVADVGNFTLTGLNNQTGTIAAPLDPLINPLSANGGPTLTHSLKAGSPALDKGNTATGGMIYDQRGPTFFRVRGGRADVGAFESQDGALPPRIVDVKVNDGVVQRSMVTSITVTFNQVVNFSPGVAASFKLVRQSDGAAVVLSSTSPSTTSEVTLTFAGGAVDFISLADGRYTLTAMSHFISNGNGRLDGNDDGFLSQCDDYLLVGTSTSGPKLYRLFGDINADGLVSAFDFQQFRLVYGTMGPSAFDYNSDNLTGAEDFNQFRLRYGMMV
jgi:hypothetical protein